MPIKLKRNYKYKPFCTYNSIYEDPYLRAWSQFMGQFPWQWTVTVTFDRSVSISVAQSQLLALLQYHSPSVRYFFVSEPGLSRSLHIHGLLNGMPSHKRLALEYELNWKFGKSEIQQYNAEHRWIPYICKYLKKGYGLYFTNLTEEDLLEPKEG